ncbi:MAG TPA: hypothetical protein PK198_27230, partial [Saprospiraceae bacterium]|nr:hypothetical protein [Saprospiraceae bacterium]
MEKQLADEMEKKFWDALQEDLEQNRQNPLPYKYQEPEEAWRKLKKITGPEDFDASPATGIDRKHIEHIVNHLQSI